MVLDEILTMCNLEKKVQTLLQKQTKQLVPILDPFWHFDCLFSILFLLYLILWSITFLISFGLNCLDTYFLSVNSYVYSER